MWRLGVKIFRFLFAKMLLFGVMDFNMFVNILLFGLWILVHACMCMHACMNACMNACMLACACIRIMSDRIGIGSV